MPDVRELLHHAAAPPTRPLDVAVLQRAARRRRSRLFAWLASLGALAAVGTPAGLQWASGGSHDTVRTVPAPTSPTTTTMTIAAGVASDPVLVPSGPADVSSLAGTGLDARSSDQTTEQSSDNASYPPAPSCSVDNSGAAPDELRTCRFTATTAGGWGGGYSSGAPGPIGGIALDDASASVVVTRHGVSTEYDTNYDKGGVGCADHVIEPGDLVEVRLRAAGNSTGPPAPYQAGAGNGWGCGHG